MAERVGTYPRRDADGRIARLPDLLGTVLAGILIGVVVLAAFDLVVELFGSGTFGGANGWLALILPAWLFVEEFRAWRTAGAPRWAVAFAGAAVGLLLGLLAAGLAAGLAPLATGAIGAVVFTLAYSVIWFYGVRWLDRRAG